MVGAFSAAAVALTALASVTGVNGYWLMPGGFITTERLDPIVTPGAVSNHVHSVVGGSNFGFESSTSRLQKSQCTSVPIKEDKSNYWFPTLYFQWANGSFSSVDGGAVIYYLFPGPEQAGKVKAFPPDFRMVSGTPLKRSHDGSAAARAVNFLCLDFDGQTSPHDGLPAKVCPSGIRSQVNFPSCWNGKDVDSPNHKSHVAYRSGGPDSGECTDPNFPVTLPRIFLEVYWGTGHWNSLASQAKNPAQPFVFSHGDRTGFGYHSDFFNGWDDGVLQKAVDQCHCNNFGDPQCCADRGIFTLRKDETCKITKQVDEVATGTLLTLPGNNPVQEGPGDAKALTSTVVPDKIAPAYVYTGDRPTQIGTVVSPGTTAGTGGGSPSSSSSLVSSSSVASTPPSSPPVPSASATSSSSPPSLSSTSSLSTQAPPGGTSRPAPPAVPPSAPTSSRQLASSSTAGRPIITRRPLSSSASPAPAPTTVTHISVSEVTRWLKPTSCVRQSNFAGHKRRGHDGNRHRQSRMRKRYDFDADDYYYVS